MEDTTPGACATMQPQHLTLPDHCYPRISSSQAMEAQKHNMHFSDFDNECFPGVLSPAFVLNAFRPTWPSGLACSTH